MSCQNAIGGVWEIFPSVTEAVENYKIAEPDRESSGLKRGVATEKTVFHQTSERLQRLLVLSTLHNDSTRIQYSEAGLDVTTTSQILDDLESLTRQLQSLKVDLVNAGRGKEVLDKIRGKFFDLGTGQNANARTRLQIQLGDLSDTNRILASRTLHGQTLLSHAFHAPYATHFCQSLNTASRRAATTFNLLNDKYNCRCHEPHIIYVRCPAFTTNPAIEQLNTGDNAKPLKVIMQPKEGGSMEDKACSFEALLVEQETRPILPLQGWMRLQRADLDWKRRIELAVQLSFSVIQLSLTPWIDDSWTWDNWAIATDTISHRSGRPLLFRRCFGSSITANGAQASKSSVWSILSPEPILAKLGLCLIELAFGKTVSEIRCEGASDEEIVGNNEVDPESLDLITAKELFESQRIRNQFGESFENAVKACIHQQFRAEKNGDIIELDSRDPSFLQNAVDSIISPLQLQAETYLRAELRDSVPIKNALNKILIDPSPTREDTTEPVHRDVVELLKTSTLLHDKDESLAAEPGSSDTQGSLSRIDLSRDRKAEAGARLGLETTDLATRPKKADVSHSVTTKAHTGTRDVSNPMPPQSRGRGQNLPIGSAGERTHLRLPSPSGQSMEESEWTYGSVTETTESARAWAAEVLDEPPGGTRNSVLSSIAPVVLRIILRHFRAWTERTPGSGNGTAASSGPLSGGRPNKRPRKQPGRGGPPDDNGDDDDDEAEQNGDRKRKKSNEDDADNKTLACPYFKKDRRAYGSCCGRKLSRIRDVKQHLKRRHYLPIYCSFCNEVFTDEKIRDQHVIRRNCERGTWPEPEGVSLMQQQELNRRANRQLPEDEQWHAIFRILFPDAPRPSSAYIDPSLSDSALAYQEYVTVRGPEILRRTLAESGAVVTLNETNVDDVDNFLRHILGEGLEAIAKAWAEEKAPVAGEMANTGVVTPSEGESLEMINASASSVFPSGSLSSASMPDYSDYARSHPDVFSWSEHHDLLFNQIPDLGSVGLLTEDDLDDVQRALQQSSIPDANGAAPRQYYTHNRPMER
ncbi:hypothetical protein CGCS363_v012081 [Colletotrichum siamense]|uniref:uncharacterized protein n=1 Tax=Colletotrichum siamense TaxID=690259 RepID=UPI00187324C4|nr:uncharacterized protein CGCS363_v012081 [Colletotrichum siamense]KAF5489815.1 hypothetical protein CGCS363_v012081 [Colletotrichum siamense]